jgi:N-acetylglucosaminyl-diphospho-decaprenol L-rhamnosyltransferase
MRPTVAISIINYRTAELTLACVRSVLADLDGPDSPDGRIVITDNASGDGSAETIADWIASQPADTPVHLVLSDTNTGFSGGHNLGIAAGVADYYLVLNSDAILRPGFLKAILDAATRHPDAGLYAPRISFDDGAVQSSCFRFHSPASELIRSARNGLVTKLLKRHEVSLGPDPDPAAIEWASFACILLRGDMVRALGPMDEGYFLYFEDAEYCLRARRAGWEIVYVPQAHAVHYRGGSGPVKAQAQARKRLPAYYYASRTRFLYQAHGWVGMIAANLLWYPGRWIAHISRLLGRGFSPMNQCEMCDIWINASRPLGPRHAPGDPI